MIEGRVTHDISQCRPCPLCQRDKVRILFALTADRIVSSNPYYLPSACDFLGVPADEQFSIAQCSDCGFVYSAQVPTADFLNRLYGTSSNLVESVRVFARPDRAAYAFHALSTLLSALATHASLDNRGVNEKPLRILDVGCAYGVGTLGLTRQHYPYEVVGVEWSQSTRDYLASQGMQVYRTIEEVPKDHKFDGILLNDVLEHVPDPASFVRNISELSHQRTVVWLNVPNFAPWRLSAIMKDVPFPERRLPADLNPWEHLSYFSPDTLDQAMALGGFARHVSSPLEYSLHFGSGAPFVKTLLRTVRDVWRIHRKRYPQKFMTAGLYIVGART